MMNLSWTNWLKGAPRSGRRNKHRRKHKRQLLRAPRLGVEPLEDRIVPNVTLQSSYTGLDSAGVGGGSEPPDTQGAAGPSSVVETVNQGISIFTPKSTGTAPVTDTLSDFYFTQGGLANGTASFEQTDPFTIFDPQVQRFIVGDLDFDTSNTNGAANYLLLAVSKSANPTTLTSSDWFFYEVTTTESGVALQDYTGNPGYNADALVVSLNGFDASSNPVHSQINAISINALINGTPLTAGSNYFQTDDSNEFLMRGTTMPDSTPGGPMWFVVASGGGSFAGAANSIDVVEMTNVLSASPTFTTTTLTVNPYFQAVVPVDASNNAIDSNTDSRMLQADEANGIIAATDEISDAAGDANLARWYTIDVSSGTPVLAQQGDVGGGPNTYFDYPGIGINAQGDIGLTYVESGKSMLESMFVTGRTPGDAPGTMETPVLVQAGTSGYSGSRQGDMSRVSVDSDGTFWAFSQWANNETAPNWGTAIGHFTLAAPLTVLPVSAVEGQPLTNVPVATFSDNSGVPLSSYVATINWGNGNTSPGQVVDDGNGNFTVIGSNTYDEEGTYTLTVMVSNGESVIGSASGIATVADAPLLGFAQALNSQVGGFLSNALVAVFTDTDQTNTPSDPQGDPSDYSATIQWFENNGLSFTSTGTIAPLFGNTFAVLGSNPFSFPTGGLFTVRVVVRDVGGASVTVDSVVSVASNPAIPADIPQFAGDSGPVSAQFVMMEDALTNLLLSERLFLQSVAFGTPDQQQTGFSNLVNAFFAYQTAVFSYDMTLPM